MPARILIIEDNAAHHDLMHHLLKAAGHTPITAWDGAEGLRRAQREMPDLVLCDIGLPRMDGFEVVRQLRDDLALQAIPIVAVTAWEIAESREQILASGFDGHISKPINPQTFVQQIEAFLPSGKEAR